MLKPKRKSISWDGGESGSQSSTDCLPRKRVLVAKGTEPDQPCHSQNALLYPELLSRAALIAHIDKCVIWRDCAALERMSTGELLDMARRYMPQPQRPRQQPAAAFTVTNSLQNLQLQSPISASKPQTEHCSTLSNSKQPKRARIAFP